MCRVGRGDVILCGSMCDCSDMTCELIIIECGQTASTVDLSRGYRGGEDK
jgi:hypothetical protein